VGCGGRALIKILFLTDGELGERALNNKDEMRGEKK
jgi:hypothetical protein